MGYTSVEKALDARFREQSHKIAKAIRAESKGRMCGSCRWLAGGSCERPSILPEWPVAVVTPQAVACKKWEGSR